MNEFVSFEGQRPGEEVIKVWRQHPWVLVRPGFTAIAIVLAVALVIRLAGASGYSSLAIVTGLVASGWIGGVALFKWWNGMYLLTTERVIDVDQRQLFHRVVGELPIENIQDATYEVRGLFATALNFGNVVVQTIGGATTLTMTTVEAPYQVQQAVLEARNKYVKGHPAVRE
jgi:hypothetical protein